MNGKESRVECFDVTLSDGFSKSDKLLPDLCVLCLAVLEAASEE